MLFLVFSDSHGSIVEMKEIICSQEQVNGIFHAGDFIADAMVLQREFPQIPVYKVCGNCDMISAGCDEEIIEIEGKRIFLTHGHKYHVKSDLRDLSYKTIEGGFDLTIFGHTHQKAIDYAGKAVMLNPGAVSGYDRSYGRVVIKDGKLSADIISL